MTPILIDPERAFVGPAPKMAGFPQAVRLIMVPPVATDNITDDHLIAYSPLAVLEPGARLFWSHRLSSFFAGKALVFGAALDGVPTAPGRGMENAIREDVVFVGAAPAAREALIELMTAFRESR